MNLTKKYKTFKATKYQNSPGSPVVRTQDCHAMGADSIPPWSGPQKQKNNNTTKYCHLPIKKWKDLKGIPLFTD